jgi:dienelactone hydrolase
MTKKIELSDVTVGQFVEGGNTTFTITGFVFNTLLNRFDGMTTTFVFSVRDIFGYDVKVKLTSSKPSNRGYLVIIPGPDNRDMLNDFRTWNV